MSDSISFTRADMPNDFLKLHPKFYSELRQAILADDPEHIKKLNHAVRQYFSQGEELTLHPSNDRYSTVFKCTNPYLFACKHAKCNALQTLLSKDATTLRTFLSGNDVREVFTARDDEGHNVFYYAMRLCDVGLLRSIISLWVNTSSAGNNEKLDELLSTSLKEIKLKNLPFSEEMLVCVVQNLIQLRFYGDVQESKNKLNRISEEERSQLVIEYIQKLREDYVNKNVDDKFVLYSQYIVENIFILKRQWKHTYDELPWEEIEFVLIVFLSYHVNKKDPMNVIYSSLINRKEVLIYLEHFSEKLKQTMVKNFKMKTFKPSPANIYRTQIKSKIIQDDAIFEDLYRTYELVRDSFSIDVISKYINLGTSCSCDNLQGQMVITRTLQVVGEYMKNTLDSPKMSPSTSEYLLSYLPYTTNQILRDLRNSLSHSAALAQRLQLETQSDSDFYRHIQNDLKKLLSAILNVENKIKLRAMEVALNRIIEFKTVEEFREMLDVTEFTQFNIKVESNNVNKELDEIYNMFREILEASSNFEAYKSILYDSNILDKINNWIQSEKQKLESAYVNYIRVAYFFRSFQNMKSNVNFDSNDARILKWAAGRVLEDITSVRDPKKVKEISPYLQDFIESFSISCDEEHFEKFQSAVYKMALHIDSKLFNLSWLEELRERLIIRRKARGVRYNYNEKHTEDQFRIKNNELKKLLAEEILETSENIIMNAAAFSNNKKLKAVVEMLTLDVLSILKDSFNHFNRNDKFLDNSYPVLVGNNLRNHLAHGTSLLDLLYPESGFYSILNAERLVNHNEIENSQKIGKETFVSLSVLKERYQIEIDVLNQKMKMFDSIKSGNLYSLKTCIKNGADIFSRDIHLCTTLHYASKGHSIDIINHFIDEGIDINSVDSNGQKPIHVAAAHGREDIVLFFIKKEVAVDCLDNLKKTPLHYAAENGKEQVVRVLVKNGASTKKEDFLWQLPLHGAVLNNHVKITEFLLKCDGGICDSLSNSMFGGFTVLHIASENGFLDIVNLLLNSNANVNAKSNIQSTPLVLAAHNGHHEVVEVLIAKGADVNAKCSDGHSALHGSTSNGYPKTTEILLSHGSKVNPVNDEKYTPLNIAAEEGHIEIVTQLLKKKADVEIASIEGFTPLHSAAKGGHLEIVKLLLKASASLKAVDCNRAIPLHLSAYFNHKDTMLCLLEHGASASATALNGETPLHFASKNGNTDVIDALINSGANINSVDDELNTPLHYSARNGHSQTASVLVSRGAFINAKNKDKQSPLWLASSNGREDIVQLLLENGASVNDVDVMQLSPLHVSSLGGLQVTKILLSNNAEIDAQTEGGFTPLHLAVLKNDVEIVKLLLKKDARVDGVTTLNMTDTPLFLSVHNKNKVIAQLLINAGANARVQHNRILGEAAASGFKDILQMLLKHTKCSVDCKLKEEMPLLIFAVIGNQTNIVNFLVNSNANVNARFEKTGATALHIACDSGNKDIVEILLKKGAKTNVRRTGYTPLHLASVSQHVEVVELLLKYGANPNLADFKNRTPLELSVARGYIEIVKVLLKHKDVNINDKGNDNFSLLHIAAQEGGVEVVKYLVQQGADVNATNNSGAKPIHIAVREGEIETVHFLLTIMDINVLNLVMGQNLMHYSSLYSQIETAKYLIEKNVDINYQDNYGNIPLHIATISGHTEFVKLLLNNGAYYDAISTRHNMTVFELAHSNGSHERATDIATLLSSTQQMFQAVRQNNPEKLMESIKEGACVNAKSSKNFTVLHFAAWKGYDEIVDILLKQGCNPNIAGKNDCTPLHYACEFNHLDIVQKLIKERAFYDTVNSNGKLPLKFASNKDIIDFLRLIAMAFDSVKNGDSTILNKLQNLKINLRMTVLSARNNDNKNILTVAMNNDFPKLKSLEILYNFEDKSTDQFDENDVLLFDVEKCEQSLVNLRQVLEKRKALFGFEDPRTIDVMCMIARILYIQNNFPEALTACEEVFKYQKKILGDNSQGTLKSMKMIALITYRLGKHHESLAIFEEVLPKLIEVFGPDHAQVLDTESDMALALNALDRHEEALKLNQRIFEKRKMTLGSTNPITLVTQNNIALVLMSDGKLTEAMEVFKDVYQKRKSVLGSTHFYTFSTAHGLINVYTLLRMYDEAIELANKTIKAQESSLGKEHNSTLKTRFMLANLFYKLGQFDEAVHIHETYINAWKMKIGYYHPLILQNEAQYIVMKKTLGAIPSMARKNEFEA